MEIYKIIEFIKVQAQKAMRRDSGNLNAKLYFVILYPGQTTPVHYPVLAFDPIIKKQMLPYYTQLWWSEKKQSSPIGIKLIAVCLIGNSDVLFTPYDGAKSPRTFESLVLNICYQHNAKCHLIPYKRKGKHIEFEPELDQSEVGSFAGWLSELYPAKP